MIIELVGLPGSGKSFLCDELENDLKRNGNRVTNINKYLTKTAVGKIRRKYLSFISRYKKSYSIHIDKMKKITVDSGTKSKFNQSIKIEDYLERIAVLIELYKKNKKILLADEGIIHLLIIMSTYFDISIDILKELVRYVYDNLEKKDFNVVYNKIGIEECLQSIKERNRKECSFDYFNEKDLNEFLDKYYKYCEELYFVFNFKTVLRNESYITKKTKIMK